MFFTINGTMWQVQYKNSNSGELKRSDGTISLGVTDNNAKTIYINNRLSDAMFEKVLCHELVHVFSFEYNYDIDIQTEEIIADFMSLFGRDIIYLLDDLVKILKRVA